MSAVIHAEGGGRLLEVTLSGKLTREDYEEFLLKVEHLIEERGKFRMLCRLTDFRGWRLGSIWQEVMFDFQHFSNIERLALVGEKRWEAGMWMFCVPFTAASVRYFDIVEEDLASEWIQEANENEDEELVVPFGTGDLTATVAAPNRGTPNREGEATHY